MANSCDSKWNKDPEIAGHLKYISSMSYSSLRFKSNQQTYFTTVVFKSADPCRQQEEGARGGITSNKGQREKIGPARVPAGPIRPSLPWCLRPATRSFHPS